MDRKKFITFAVVAAFALIPATANADPYEPNDSALTAWGPLYPSTDYVATMDTANDQDWFVFYAPYREQTSATFTGGPGAYTRVVLEGTDVNGNVEESGGARDPTHQGAPGEQHVAHGRVPVHRQHPWRHVLLQPGRRTVPQSRIPRDIQEPQPQDAHLPGVCRAAESAQPLGELHMEGEISLIGGGNRRPRSNPKEGRAMRITPLIPLAVPRSARARAMRLFYWPPPPTGRVAAGLRNALDLDGVAAASKINVTCRRVPPEFVCHVTDSTDVVMPYEGYCNVTADTSTAHRGLLPEAVPT